MRERFDLAISRATAPPPVLCELALPLAPGGRYALRAGRGRAGGAGGVRRGRVSVRRERS